METLGQFIRSQRDRHDFSLREFAKRLGRSAPFLSDIELGRRYPSEEVLADIARVLQVSIEDLKSRDTRPPLEDIKRITDADPRYALAFRTLINRKVSAKQLMDLAERQQDSKPASKPKK